MTSDDAPARTAVSAADLRMPGSTDALPEQIAAFLSRLKRRARRLTLLRGMGLSCAVAAVSLLVVLSVDWLVCLEPAARETAVVLAIVAVLTAAVRWLAIPMLRPFAWVELAAAVEARFSRLSERLSSAVELCSPRVPERHKGSAELRALVIGGACDDIAEIRAATVFSSYRARRAMLAGAAAICSLIAPFAVAPEVYSLSWARLRHPSGNYDAAANLYFEVDGGDRPAARGRDVVIRARPRHRSGNAVSLGDLLIELGDARGNADRRLMKFDESSQSFVATVGHVRESFDFRVSSGRVRSRTYRVDVDDAPGIAELSLEIAPPEYTRRARTRIDAIGGRISIFEGSRLDFRLTFNKRIAEARWYWSPDAAANPVETVPSPAPPQPTFKSTSTILSVSDDGMSARFAFVPAQDGRISFGLVDDLGLHSLPSERAVHVRIDPDAPPTLELSGSQDEVRVHPYDMARIDVRARDDVGIDLLALEYRIGDGKEIALPAPGDRLGTSDVSHTFRLDVPGLQVPDGTTIFYRMRAADARPRPGSNVTVTPERRLIVDVDAPPTGSNSAAGSDSLAAQFARIRRQFAGSKERVLLAEHEAQKSGADGRAFSVRVREAVDSQVELSRLLEVLADELSVRPVFAPLVEPVRALGTQHVAASLQAVEQSTIATEQDRHKHFASAIEHLKRAELQLDEIEQQYQRLLGIEADVRDLGRLARQAERLAHLAHALDQQRRSQPSNSNSEDQQAAREQFDRKRGELAAGHAKISAQLKDLLARRPELVDAARQQALSELKELGHEAADLALLENSLADGVSRHADQHPSTETLPQPGGPSRSPLPADFARTVLASQNELAKRAVQLAVEAALLAGVETPAAQQSARMTRHAVEAHRLIIAGQIEEASNALITSSTAADEAAGRLAGEMDADDTRLASAGQLRLLAEEQRQLSQQLRDAAKLPTARVHFQQNGQRHIRFAAEQLAVRLDDAAGALSSEPLNLSDAANTVQNAYRHISTAQTEMRLVEAGLETGDGNQAAPTARSAGLNLDRASQLLARFAGPEHSGVPQFARQVGDRLADASRRLKRAGGQLSAAAPPADADTNNDRDDPRAHTESNEGDDSNSLKKFGENLDRAAEALSDAAQSVERDPRASRSARSWTDQPEGRLGTGGRVLVDLSELQIEIERLARRQWGELPSDVRMEILRAPVDAASGWYEQLIRDYFRQLAGGDQTDFAAPANESIGNQP